MSPTTRVNITLDERTRELLDGIERLTGANRSEIIRRGVEAYKKELEGVFLKEAIDVQLSTSAKATKTDRKRASTRKRP